jgi:hypothetical protein
VTIIEVVPNECSKVLISRITGQVRSSTHFSGFGVNQDLGPAPEAAVACAPQDLHFTLLHHAVRVPEPMRLSVFGSIVRATLLLLPAVISLFLTSYVWASRKQPELFEKRVRIFRRSLTSAWIATALFLVASIEQLKTRQLLPGFWLVLNLSAALLVILGFTGAVTGRGWARALLLGWGVLLILGMFAVVVSTIP